MLKKITGIFMFLGLLALPLFAGDEPKKAEDFTLEDYNGVKHSLSDYKDSKAIVLMFIATQCPVSNAYNTRMVEFYKDYSKKNVAVIGINSNKQESVEEIKDHSKTHGFEFTVLKDWNNIIADKFEASFTPEIYVLNSKFEVLYHGRIDDSSRENNVKSKDLRAAVDNILAGKPVVVASTKAFGCTIKRVE
ncbi:MAG: thioredoxin family protein [Ignavibacteriales bacterium]|nr:thioredoxin family protein [Ignavibacteriales bacterium]